MLVALLLAACTSDTGSEENEDFGGGSKSAVSSSGCPSDTVSGSDSTSTTDLLSTALGNVVEGAENAAGADLFGWVLSAIGVGGEDGSAIDNQISSELQAINTTLVDICNQLAAISSELQTLTCATDAQWLSDPASDIDNWYGQYIDFVTDTQQGSPPPQTKIATWVNAVLDTDNGAFHAISQLKDLGTASTSKGSISDCIAAQTTSVGKPDPGTLDDRPYYEAVVAPIQNWFYGYNTMAYVSIAEAYHYSAWLDAGEPTGEIDNTLPDVCAGGSSSGSPSTPATSSAATTTAAPTSGSTSTTDSVDFNCVQSQTIYANQLLPWLIEEISIGGAPYSTDDSLMANGAGWLIATNLEDYTAAAGGSCSSPLMSSNQCGPLVGPPGYTIPSVKFGNYGKSGGGTWSAATVDKFNGMLNGFQKVSSSDTKTTAAAWLCTGKSGSNATTNCSVANKYKIDGAGLENADKIIVFDKQIDDGFGSIYPGATTWCFVDGSIARNYASQPFCDSGDGSPDYDGLLESHNVSSLPANTCTDIPNNTVSVESWKDSAGWTRANGPVSSHGFYSGILCEYYENGKNPNSYYEWSDSPPHYAPAASTQSYHWPVLTWTDLVCTDALDPSLNGKSVSEALNPGGVPTTCGDDYAQWLDSILPLVG